MAAGESSDYSYSGSNAQWGMLDRYVFTRYDLATCGGDEDGGATSPECRTGQGVPFRISLRLSAPPAVSRFFLHMPAGAAETHCRILASHRDALLFSMSEPFPEPVDGRGTSSRPSYDQELFVYVAGSTPSLTLLPPCCIGSSMVEADYYASDSSSLSDGAPWFASDDDDDDSDTSYDVSSYDTSYYAASDDDDEGAPDDQQQEEEDYCYDPLAGITQFEPHALGIHCNNNGGDYVVAYLCVSRCLTPGSGAEVVEAQMCLYSSSKSTWELHGLPIFYQHKQDLDHLTRWSTNIVTTFGSYLCWVDYNCSILFCDVFAEALQVTYLSLPIKAHHSPRAAMNMYRNICVLEDGHYSRMKFIDVTPYHGYYFRPPPSSHFELNIWTLAIKDDEDGNTTMSWAHELVIHDYELRSIGDLVPSPHGPLMYPVMSMEDPHVAYFVVGPWGCSVRKMWIVPVDLNGRSAKCAFPYLKGEEDLLGEDADMARTKAHCFEPFLPCHISLFFPQPLVD